MSALSVTVHFAGFRALASNGIDLTVLNVFRMFSKMGGRRVAAESSAAIPLDTIVKDGVGGAPDIAALASADAGRVAVTAWHYHDDDVPGPEAAVELTVSGLPSAVREASLTHYRIDELHSDAYAAWKRMGSPIAPTREQYSQLQEAGWPFSSPRRRCGSSAEPSRCAWLSHARRCR